MGSKSAFPGWQALLAGALVAICFGLAVSAYGAAVITVFAPVMLTVGPSGFNALALVFMAVTVLGMYVFNDVVFKPNIWRWMLFSFCAAAVSVLISIATRRDASAYIDTSYYGSQSNIWLATSISLFTILSMPLAHMRRKPRLSSRGDDLHEKPNTSSKKNRRDDE